MDTDVRAGDLVLVTSYSWISTANVVELCGAQPVFVDIRPDTFNMDPNCLETALQELMVVPDTARRVKAILPVHTFGQMADMPEILELADRLRFAGDRGRCMCVRRYTARPPGGYLGSDGLLQLPSSQDNYHR